MRSIIIVCVSLLFGMICYGQNTAEQYMKDPSLALQDARASYEDGNYEKTINLIRIYASLSGKSDAQNLLSNAQQCQQLVEKAKIYEEQGDDSAAAQCYRSILEINPNDKNAKNKVTVSYDEIGDYHSLGIAKVRKGNKWGAIDKEKNIVVPIVYDNIGPWSFGYWGPKQTTCMAERDGKTVFVNMHGQEVTPDNLYYAIRGIELDTPNLYYLVYKYNSPEVYVDMNGVEYPTEDEAAYGILGLKENNTITSGPYRIGDFYNENGCKGVVFDVDATGMNGKIVSLMNGYEVWADEESPYSTTHIGLFDENDGESNFRIIKQIRNWMTIFPAFKWCNQLGEGWYLPANNELALIENNITKINEGVRIAGHRPLEIVNVISSTEDKSDSSKVFYIYYGDFQPLDKKYKYHLLAVKKFGRNNTYSITRNKHEYVDLGLSVMWATCNIGANAPEEYGDYFSWGELSPKQDYSTNTYSYYGAGGYSKYNTEIDRKDLVDNNTLLDLVDDVAHEKWGEKWRIPTEKELSELYGMCIWEWTKERGTPGYKVTSKINGNSIFMPAAGYMEYGSLKESGSSGHYWSSNLNLYDYSFYADYWHFESSKLPGYSYNGRRYMGKSVRPVYSNRASNDLDALSHSNDEMGFTNGHGWVDLGLPSGIKWATCNVGASSPTDYGFYFAWGETSPKNKYYWTDYKFRTKGDNYDNVQFNKYNAEDNKRGPVDNKCVLDASNDAAHKNWGDNWRMPTKDEFYELLANCTFIWVTDGGTNGYIVVSRINGKSIFFPAAGCRYEGAVVGKGTGGYYWSSTLNSIYALDAESWRFFVDNEGGDRSDNRFIGYTVRPVIE